MITHPRSGFTLLEFIIVMSLLAVIAAIGAPKLSAALTRRETSTAADRFVSAHSLARATAVRFGRTARLHINAPAKRFWIDVDTSRAGINQRATVWYVRELDAVGLTMTSNRSLLCFDARGLAITGNSCQQGDARVIFTQSEAADTVVTTTLGKVLR